MAAMERKGDRRSRRTQRLVTGAMAELLQEKPYDRITVQDILDRADVGRSSFYAHFRDKQDVVQAVALTMFEGVHAAEEPGPVAGGRIPVLGLFRHARERSASLRMMLDAPGAEAFWSGSQAALVDVLVATSPTRGRAPGPVIPAVVEAQFLAGALLGLLRWWLRDGMPYPPERMAAMFEALVAGSTATAGPAVAVVSDGSGA
ncbi:MAG: TetR/AcrR family transcriptional regulator [Chloroflexota bacterium]